MFANVVLQSGDTVITDDKPEFEGAEATAQRDAPMLNKFIRLWRHTIKRISLTYSVIDGFVRVTVLQVKRIDNHGLG